MKLFPIDTFVGENFLAGETLAASLPLIRPIDLNINPCLLYDSCILPAVEERRNIFQLEISRVADVGGGTAGSLLVQQLCFL